MSMGRFMIAMKHRLFLLLRGRAKNRKVLFISLGLLTFLAILYVKPYFDEDEDSNPPVPHFTKMITYKPRPWLITPLISGDAEKQEACYVFDKRFIRWTIVLYSSKEAWFAKCENNQIQVKAIKDSFIKNAIGREPHIVGSSFGRTKAYISAIANKADYIYVADNLTDILHLNRIPFAIAKSYEGLAYPGNREDFDPYVHFGCRKGTAHEPWMSTKYKICEGAIPVLQSNAILYSEDRPKGASGRSACLEDAPPVLIKRTLAPLPIDLNNALYKKEIFWALPIIPFENEEQRATWTFLIQLCLFEAGHHIHLNGVVERYRNQSLIQNTYGERFLSQERVTTLKKMVKVADIRTSGLFNTFNTLLAKMTLNGYADSSRVREHALWMKVVLQLDRHLHLWHNPQPMVCTQSVIYDAWHRHSDIPAFKNEIQNINIIRNTFNMFCPNEKMHGYEIGKYDTRHFSDIALVVIYNQPHDVSVPFVEMLYRPHFPIIIHCSPETKDSSSRRRFEDFSQRGWKFIFIEYQYTGPLSYECIHLVLKLRLNVKGFLFIGDDVIFSPHDIPKFSTKIPWINTPGIKCPTRKLSADCEQWPPAKENTERMKRVYDTFNSNANPITYGCSKNLHAITGKYNWFVAGKVDVYYLPHNFAMVMDKLLGVYLTNQVYVDIAVHNMIHCLSWDGQIERLKGINVKGTLRRNFYDSFDLMKSGNFTFLHPAKWSYVHNRSKKNLQVFCDDVVPFYHKRHVG